MKIIDVILINTFIFALPIVLSTLGGLIAYKLNIVNIGLEGFMLLGGLFSGLGVYYTKSYVVGLLICLIFSGLIGLIYAFFAIKLKSNFIITGFAINVIAGALSAYILITMDRKDLDLNVVNAENLKLVFSGTENIPILNGLINAHSPMFFITIIIFILLVIIFNSTRFGTYIKVIGENEKAARAQGIKVDLIKYLALILSALIVGLGGFTIAVEQIKLFTPDIIAGTGFIAIAAFYCGNGRPSSSLLYALLFGLAKALAFTLAFNVPQVEGIIKIVPYVAIVIVLTVTAIIKRKKSLMRGVYQDE